MDLLSADERITRGVLERSVEMPFTSQDVAAALLGKNLWYEPLMTYRFYLETIQERPHLWTFAFGPSGDWNSNLWRSLSLNARLVRTRAAPLTLERDVVFAPSTTGLDRRRVHGAVDELCAAGLCTGVRANIFRLNPIVSSEALEVDLSLIEIIAHWLSMLAHADRVARDRTPSGFEVNGYSEACPRCEEQWGIRPRTPEWIPPFHPGCRCFAQPRFSPANTRR
ncbi:MAG TPA: hypothetical protein VMF11_06610 [Candidatus Baltobacteraceae bacterium]|nr:hypothetical protein [Candidatus Baltobacteraceae bacterium]